MAGLQSGLCLQLHNVTCVENTGRIVVWLVERSDVTGCVKKNTPHTEGCVYVCVCLCIYCMYLYVYICTECGWVSHPDGALVSGVGRGHGHGAAAPLGGAGGLQHAGVEACVSPGMFSQVVAPHEALVTHRTVEALLARVRAVVTRQLV